MTRGNPTRLILSFALPLIASNLGQQLYMMTDTIIVGQGVGLGALASLGATDWIYWLVLWPVQMLTQGFAILITQNIGAGDERGISRSIAMSALLCLIIGAAISVVFPLIAGPLLNLLKTPDDIFEGALSYVTVMYEGTIVVIAYNMASAVLRSFGDGKTPLIAMAIAAVVNIGLDLLFVMEFGWGIVGAAVATLIAQLIACLYCLRIIRKIPSVKIGRGDWRADTQLMGRLMRLGLPLALSHVIIVAGGVVLQFMVNGFGSLFIAAFTASNKLNGLLESSAISFGFATATYVAQNWGAGKIERIRSGINGALRLSLVVAVVISVVMILFGKNLLMMFISASDANAPLALELAYQYLIILSVSLIILYFLHVYRSAIQGLGNAVVPMVAGFLECVGRVSIALMLPGLVGEIGLFFAEPTAWLFSAVYLMISYYSMARKIDRPGLPQAGP